MTGLTALFVTWQAQPSRRIFPIARLMVLPGGKYEFAYVRAVAHAEQHGFTGLPGFETLDRVYISATLPALFKERPAQRGRDLTGSDRPEPANDQLDVSPLTVFVPRADGSGNDRLEVFAPPLRAGERHQGVFAARGVNQPPTTPATVEDARAGEPLDLSPEPNNPINPKAIRIERAGSHLGYFPDYFASELGLIPNALSEFSLHIERISRLNHPPAAPLYQVLCKYTCTERIALALFNSPEYQPRSPKAAKRVS